MNLLLTKNFLIFSFVDYKNVYPVMFSHIIVKILNINNMMQGIYIVSTIYRVQCVHRRMRYVLEHNIISNLRYLEYKARFIFRIYFIFSALLLLQFFKQF